MDKDEAKAKFQKADRRFRSGRFDEALLILDELDEVFPEDRRVLYPRARCLAELSRLDEALQLCDFMVGKWDYIRAMSLRRRILERERAVSSDSGLGTSGAESEGEQKTTPIPPILLDDGDELFESPIDFEHEDEESPADSEPQPIPGSDEAERRYGAPIEELPRIGRPVARKKTKKNRASRDTGQADEVSWKTVEIVGGSLIVSSAFFLAVAIFRGPLSEENIGSILSNMGVLGYVIAALLVWCASAGVMYGVLRWAEKMPYEKLGDNVLDVAIMGLVETILLIVPIVGLVLGIVLVKQKYSLDLRQTGAHVGLEVAALFTIAAVLWLSFSSPSGAMGG